MVCPILSGPVPLVQLCPGRPMIAQLCLDQIPHLLNLVLGGCLIIGSRGSGTALVSDGRGRGRNGRVCDGGPVWCGRSAGKE